MTKFEQAVKRTLEHEGGFVEHAADPGGATNYGISLRWYRIAVDPDATAQTIFNMTKQRAMELYKEHWWLDAYDLIHDQDVAAKVFDMAVNMGAKQAHKLLQRACIACGKDLEVDGTIGPLTTRAVNSFMPEALLAAIRAVQADFYCALVEKDPAKEVFLKGWLKRAQA